MLLLRTVRLHGLEPQTSEMWLSSLPSRHRERGSSTSFQTALLQTWTNRLSVWAPPCCRFKASSLFSKIKKPAYFTTLCCYTSTTYPRCVCVCVTPAAHRQFSCHRNICTDVYLSVFVLPACIKRELIKCQMQIYGPAHQMIWDGNKTVMYLWWCHKFELR